MGVEIQLYELWIWRVQIRSPDLTPLDFCLRRWMKSEVYKEKVNTRDELVARISKNSALLKQEHQDDLRRATRTIVKRVEKCVEVDGGIFEHLLWTVAIYWDHLHNKWNQYVICIFFIPFVRLFMRNIQTAVSPYPLKIGHMFIWTYLLGIVHTTTS